MLRAAYRGTRYSITSPALTLRVRKYCPALDRWLRRLGVCEWALLTAWNPGSRRLSCKRNSVRQQRLRAALERMGYRSYPARNVPLGVARRWTEESLFVPGLPLGPARNLARRFDQAALLAGRFGQPARLVFL